MTKNCNYFICATVYSIFSALQTGCPYRCIMRSRLLWIGITKCHTAFISPHLPCLIVWRSAYWWRPRDTPWLLHKQGISLRQCIGPLEFSMCVCARMNYTSTMLSTNKEMASIGFPVQFQITSGRTAKKFFSLRNTITLFFELEK